MDISNRRQRMEDRVVEHAKKYEGKEPNVYLDPKGIPTIGYGYALGDKDGNLKSSDKINQEMNDKLGTKDKVYFTQQDMEKLKNAKSVDDVKGVGPTLSDGEMDKMLKGHVKEHADRVDRHVKSLGKDPESLTEAERAALTDLSIRGGDNLIGSKSEKLNEAIKNDDKDAMLHEIEHGSNGDKLPGNDVRMKDLADQIRQEESSKPESTTPWQDALKEGPSTEERNQKVDEMFLKPRGESSDSGEVTPQTNKLRWEEDEKLDASERDEKFNEIFRKPSDAEEISQSRIAPNNIAEGEHKWQEREIEQMLKPNQQPKGAENTNDKNIQTNPRVQELQEKKAKLEASLKDDLFVKNIRSNDFEKRMAREELKRIEQELQGEIQKQKNEAKHQDINIKHTQLPMDRSGAEKMIQSGKRIADALAAEAVPNGGRPHDVQMQKHMSQAIRRTMVDLNANDDAEKLGIIAADNDLLTDANLHPKQDPHNDEVFKEVTTNIRERLKKMSETKEDSGDVIKQEVQKGFGKLRFSAKKQGIAMDILPQSKFEQAEMSRPLSQATQSFVGQTQQGRDEVQKLFELEQEHNRLNRTPGSVWQRGKVF